MSYLQSSEFKFIFITNVAKLAQYAVHASVQRIMVDLEIMGKVERQGHINSLISRHNMEDVKKIRKAVPEAELIVRLNPIYEKTQEEVNQAISYGADLLMLPMFKTLAELEYFCECVRDRAKIIPLVETPEALNLLSQIVEMKDTISEIYLGLNDLHLAYHLNFMFELLSDGTVESCAKIMYDAGIKFGFGGIARIGEGLLPAENVLAEHLRLGSNTAILSRTFYRSDSKSNELKAQLDFIH